MKKIFFLVTIFLLFIGIGYSQNAESGTEGPVMQFDDAVSALAKNIHAKLIEKKAEKITIGQFVLQNNAPPFSSYWVNHLTGELTNMNGRNYTIFTGGSPDADWIISGEIVLVADIIRIYTTLIHVVERNRLIEASFYSSFLRDEHINEMISVGSGSSGSTAAGRDSYEPDSWENPVSYSIGNNANAPLMNRTLTPDDEDFFLLIPDRDGRLTAETVSNIDTYMIFYNYDTEEELAANDDGGQDLNARININVQAGTRYLAVVRGFSSSNTGAYGFRAYMTVREGSGGWSNPITYEIGTDENNIVAANRTLRDGDEDYFLLVPPRSGRITIETTGRLDTYMELYDANDRDEALDEDDDSGVNYNARIRYTVQAGSRYIVRVRGYSSSVSGSYGFRAFYSDIKILPPDQYEPNDQPSQATPIEIGASQEHTFHSKDDVDWFIFQVPQAGRITINTRGINSNRLDTYIELFDNNLNLIAEDDDGGNGLSSLLSLNLDRGTYYLKVWCLDDEPDQGYIITINSGNQ